MALFPPKYSPTISIVGYQLFQVLLSLCWGSFLGGSLFPRGFYRLGLGRDGPFNISHYLCCLLGPGEVFLGICLGNGLSFLGPVGGLGGVRTGLGATRLTLAMILLYYCLGGATAPVEHQHLGAVALFNVPLGVRCLTSGAYLGTHRGHRMLFP